MDTILEVIRVNTFEMLDSDDVFGAVGCIIPGDIAGKAAQAAKDAAAAVLREWFDAPE